MILLAGVVMWFRYKQHSLIAPLLSRGAKVTDVDACTGCTALHYVLQYPGVTSGTFTEHINVGGNAIASDHPPIVSVHVFAPTLSIC